MRNFNKTSIIRSFTLALALTSAASVHATIVSTNVEAGMEIRYTDNTGAFVVDATATDSGATSASVAISGDTTGASAYANLGYSSLGAESATLDFDIGYNGGGYTGNGYMGQSSNYSNSAYLEYTAMSNFDMVVDWSFDYSGPNPFGLQIIDLSGGPDVTLGNFGQVGHHEGSTNYSMVAGNTYLLQVAFVPNVWGGIGSIDGSLAGYFNFTFDQTQVPAPGALVLLAIGLIGLGAGHRRRNVNA